MDDITRGYGIFILNAWLPDDFGNLYIPFDGERFVWPNGLLEKRRYWFIRE